MDNNFVGKIDKIKWNSKKQSLVISGFCYFEGIEIAETEKVRKSLIISNGEKSYVIKAKNTARLEHNHASEGGLDYTYCGFSCVIDVGFIDGMKPLDEGNWNIHIYLNSNGKEYRGPIALLEDVVQNEENNLQDSNTCDVENSYEWLYNANRKVSIKANDNCVSIVSEIDKNIKVNPLKNKVESEVKKVKKTLIKKKKKCFEKIGICAYNTFCLFPINEDRVAFLTDSRGGLYGNFRYVNDELERRGVKEIKYMLKPHDNMNKNIVEKLKVMWYLATSKAVMFDDYYPMLLNIKPREGVKLIQLWHAPGAFKTFGFSRVGKLGWSKNPRAKNHRTYTHAIVSSTDLKKHYAEAYAIPEERVFATGVPRTDVFFDKEYEKNKVDELLEKYPILKGKKVIMFAPTFRGKGRGGYYNFENLDIDALREEFGDEYVMIMKLHPFISNKPDYEGKYDDFMIDLSHETDINDLLFVSDVLITDYSSVCFEYSLLNRPMIFFAYDKDDYISKRDFYYPYDSFVPGPIVENSSELIDVIKNEKYELGKLESFRNRFFDDFDGKSTERVVDMILE